MKPTQKLSVKFVMAFGWGLEGYMTVFMLPHLTICRRTHANHQSSTSPSLLTLFLNVKSEEWLQL